MSLATNQNHFQSNLNLKDLPSDQPRHKHPEGMEGGREGEKKREGEREKERGKESHRQVTKFMKLSPPPILGIEHI